MKSKTKKLNLRLGSAISITILSILSINWQKTVLSLIIDISDIFKRFYRLLISIRKRLIHINSSIQFSETEIKLLEEVIEALQPVKTAVEVICREDATLLTADITFKFMLYELSEQKNIFSDELKDATIIGISTNRPN
jgi:hypothetical protein